MKLDGEIFLIEIRPFGCLILLILLNTLVLDLYLNRMPRLFVLMLG